MLGNKYTLEKLIEAEPSLKEKILNFFKGASVDYADVPKLSGAAKRYYRTYKKLFDEFSARNAENNAMEPFTYKNGSNVNENSVSDNVRTINGNNMSVSDRQYAFGVTQEDIDRYVENAYTKQNTEDYKKYSKVDQKLVDDVAPEIDITGYSHALRDNDIRHIKISHGENTNEKYPVTKEDIKNIPSIVASYDKVIVFKKDANRVGLMYVKVIPNNLVYYLEQVTTKYGNEKLLINKQMIKTGINDIPDIPGLKTAIEQKESETEFLADLNKVRQVYAQSVYQSHSINSIPENQKNVKGIDENSLENSSDKKFALPMDVDSFVANGEEFATPTLSTVGKERMTYKEKAFSKDWVFTKKTSAYIHAVDDRGVKRLVGMLTKEQ